MSTRVLVYDHSAVILANFQYWLQQAGFDVTARFPREINLDEIQKHQPDAIVLGLLGMQHGNALERMIAVHDEPTAVHIPIVVTTPREQNMTLPLPEAGMFHVPYDSQPFRIDDVIAAVRACTQPDG